MLGTLVERLVIMWATEGDLCHNSLQQHTLQVLISYIIVLKILCAPYGKVLAGAGDTGRLYSV
jgi:hypothetical protein